ncbi:hypothetical protein CY34DRAFT_805860 [Suillus luteus UH-Slu-Lm8-n1]|uniref:Uncharacterized protein n=1 Tax=Suillus luteus UH-Slu-Lm8-n1 TaxID=930992 RepID=A0A0D0AUJ9_9AGAM|nr:hypothetical protein CY34DRAFT_805860 [Suillus luteus UH-Slu-Lm8-n1]
MYCNTERQLSRQHKQVPILQSAPSHTGHPSTSAVHTPGPHASKAFILPRRYCCFGGGLSVHVNEYSINAKQQVTVARTALA